jgi:Bacterial Ig-like domain
LITSSLASAANIPWYSSRLHSSWASFAAHALASASGSPWAFAPARSWSAGPFDDQIFDNQQGTTATISGLTITGGDGGVRNYEGDLTLDRVAVKGNTADLSGFGGGIYSTKGTLNLTDSTVSGNSATNQAGVLQLSGTVNITNTTISGNKTTGFSGGVFSAALDSNTTMNILNSTIANNESARLGGGIMTQLGAAVFVKNTIVAGNSIENCNAAQFGGVISSQGNNISSDDSCHFTKPADKQNTNPLLGPLQNNGGPTNTHALLPGSPAVDAANATACPQRDQRGTLRKDGDKNGSVVCDIGSFERNDLTPPTVTTTSPRAGKTGVERTTDLSATFSERMDRATLNKSTFKIFKVNADNSTTQINAVTVSSTTDGLKATLNSDNRLAKNTEYEVVVTTGAKDLSGNRLDQNRTQPNNQPMEWTFTTGTS